MYVYFGTFEEKKNPFIPYIFVSYMKMVTKHGSVPQNLVLLKFLCSVVYSVLK